MVSNRNVVIRTYARITSHTHTYVQTYIVHTYIHTYTHIYTHTCTHNKHRSNIEMQGKLIYGKNQCNIYFISCMGNKIW